MGEFKTMMVEGGGKEKKTGHMLELESFHLRDFDMCYVSFV